MPGFLACAYTGTAAITKTPTINFGVMEVSRICTGSTMLSGPAEIPPKHFCKKSGNKLVCDFLVGDVRFGSKADICGAPTHVRFTPIATAKADLPQWSCLLHPNGGHVRCSSLCLLWAKSGHQAARAIRVSISPRSAAKSMG